MDKEKDGDNLAFIVVATLTPKANDATVKVEVFDATEPNSAIATAFAGSLRNKGLSRAAKKAFENLEKGAINGTTNSGISKS